jgi:hypothetical protein
MRMLPSHGLPGRFVMHKPNSSGIPLIVPLFIDWVHPWIVPARLAVIMVALKNFDCIQNPVCLAFSSVRSFFSGVVSSLSYRIIAASLSRPSRAPNMSSSYRSSRSLRRAKSRTYSSSSDLPLHGRATVSSKVKSGLSKLEQCYPSHSARVKHLTSAGDRWNHCCRQQVFALPSSVAEISTTCQIFIRISPTGYNTHIGRDWCVDSLWKFVSHLLSETVARLTLVCSLVKIS